LWHLRDFLPEDLEAAVRLDDASTTTAQPPMFALADVIEALTGRHPAVVATVGGELIGTAISRIDGERAWVLRLALDPRWRGRGLGSALLGALEQRLLGAGVRRISAVLPDDETGSEAFRNCGFRQRSGVSYYEKTESVTPHSVAVLTKLGGAVPPAGLWARVAGMTTEKRLIERRVVLPLARPELAGEHGVVAPRAIVLFGPPGTGKTTFARAIASRLGWPFVELYPSRLSTAEGGLPAGLADAFARVRELEHVVVFIDEVEEIAGSRTDRPEGLAVVNELLKALVTFRELDGRLLVVATNSVRALDPAFLRHGRFDYVLPIGPPDAGARAAIWRGHLAAARAAEVEVDPLVESSAGLTPADIGHAARVVAQRTFECTVDTGARCVARTADYLAAIAAVRPTVTEAMIREFEEDIARTARS
jgi:MoxR-like ATPase/GNAT superfamily N-acetyltransferase